MRYLTAMLALVWLAAVAPAAVITFEGVENTIYGGPIVRMNLSIGNVEGDVQHFHEINSTTPSYLLPNNGTGVLLNDRDSRIFFTPAAGAPFDVFTLNSLDIATATGNLPAEGIIITGYRNGAVTGTISRAIGAAYDDVSGAALGTVDLIIFDGTGGQGGFVLDNFDFTPGEGDGPVVPEPATWALFVSALTAVGLSKRFTRSR